MKEIYTLIKHEYQQLQDTARHLQADRQAEVYDKIPRITDINKEINLLGIKHIKTILVGLADNVQADLTTQLVKLNAEKINLLTQAGYPIDYLDISYTCDVCKDTGILPSGLDCTCYKQKLTNYMYKQSNLNVTEIENFDTFDKSYYPDDINPAKYGIRISPKDNILEIKDIAVSFIANFDKPDQKNLLFRGCTGVGKTFMINCIAAELIKKGKTVIYQTAPTLFNIIAEYKMKSFKDKDYSDVPYKSIFNSDLLIIDDLGTESVTEARYAELLTILNTRQLNNNNKSCKTIISTNLNMKEILECYTERIISRIVGNFKVLLFVGKDIRIAKRQHAST